MRQHRVSSPHDGVAMSFEEIGKELGITRGGAWIAYKTGMRKLSDRCHRTQLEVIRALAAAKQGHHRREAASSRPGQRDSAGA